MPVKPRQRRHRIYWSCTNCRRSKQKCDTESPCRTCILRGKQETCHYGEQRPPAQFNQVAQKSALSPIPYSTGPDCSTASSPTRMDLFSIGYSSKNWHNSVGILMRLEQCGHGAILGQRQHNCDLFSTPAARERYKTIMAQLPCQKCVRGIVDHFFAEVNWHNTLLDQNYFEDRLMEFDPAKLVQDTVDSACWPLSSTTLLFPAVLFQVLANGLQFMPGTYSPHAGHKCLLHETEASESKYSELSSELLLLFKRSAVNLTFVLAQFLRVSWLKNRGQVLESWHVLGQLAHNAQEIGLHCDQQERVDAADGDTACEQSWELHMRRRTMVNLYLWDSQMAVILGKSMTLNLAESSIVPPIDCDVPSNPNTTIPAPRRDFDEPSPFTLRLLEFPLARGLRSLRRLEGSGPHSRNHVKAMQLHQYTMEYIESLPPLYWFDNPDMSWDQRCPWLVAQRHYLRSSIMFFLLVLHRPYLFYVPQSRRALLLCGVALLDAQQKFFDALKPIHHTLCALTYLAIEPCISILAVVTSHPGENVDLVSNALAVVQLAMARLEQIGHTNPMARSGLDVIHNLWTHANVATNRTIAAAALPVVDNFPSWRGLSHPELPKASLKSDLLELSAMAPPTRATVNSPPVVSLSEAQGETSITAGDELGWSNNSMFTPGPQTLGLLAESWAKPLEGINLSPFSSDFFDPHKLADGTYVEDCLTGLDMGVGYMTPRS